MGPLLEPALRGVDVWAVHATSTRVAARVRWLLAALAFFDERGHRPLARACKSLLRAAGSPLPRAGRGESRVSGELRRLGVTSREMDVLGLVADGRSNREIAARLHLSVRTVEGHIGTLKAKLGAASRAELVARAGRMRS